MRIKNRSIALLLAAMLALPVSPVRAAGQERVGKIAPRGMKAMLPKRRLTARRPRMMQKLRTNRTPANRALRKRMRMAQAMVGMTRALRMLPKKQ